MMDAGSRLFEVQIVVVRVQVHSSPVEVHFSLFWRESGVHLLQNLLELVLRDLAREHAHPRVVDQNVLYHSALLRLGGLDDVHCG